MLLRILLCLLALAFLTQCKFTDDHQKWVNQHHLKIINGALDSATQKAQTKKFIGLQPRNDLNGGFSSRTLANGKVVGVFDTFIPIQTSEDTVYQQVKYVVVNFASDNTIDTGNLSPTSHHNTEVWRYSNSTWCPVVRNLRLNITTAVERTVYVMPGSDTVRVQIFTGDASGIPGEIAFDDKSPLQSDCMKAKFETVMFNYFLQQGVYYQPLRIDTTIPGAPSGYFNQPIAGMKTQIVYGARSLTDSSLVDTGERILTIWTAPGCEGKLDSSVRSGCKDDKLINSAVWVAKYTTSFQTPGYLLTYLWVNPKNSKADQTRKDAGFTRYWQDGYSKVESNIQRIGEGADARYLVRMSLMPYHILNYVVVTQENNYLPQLTVHEPDLSWKALSPYNPENMNQARWPYYFKIKSTAFLNSDVLTGYDRHFELVDIGSGVPYHAQGGPMSMLCSLSDKLRPGYQCSFLRNDNPLPVNSWFLPEYFAVHMTEPTAIRGVSGIPDGFFGNTSYVTAQPVSEFANFGKDSTALVGLRALSSYEKNTPDNMGIRFFSPDASKPNPIKSEFQQLPNNFNPWYYKYSLKPNTQGYLTYDIHDPQVILQKGDQDRPDLVYILFSSVEEDKSLPSQIYSTPRTSGGVYFCVARYLGKKSGTIDDIAWNDCNKARPMATESNPYPVGSSVATAADISNNSTYLSTPEKVQLVLSPDGDVYINYLAVNQGLYTINASQMSGDNFKNWSRAQRGRSTSCVQALKDMHDKRDFWGQFSDFSLSSVLSIGFELLAPEGGSIILELQWGFLENFVLDSGSSAKMDPRSLLKTSCTVN